MIDEIYDRQSRNGKILSVAVYLLIVAGLTVGYICSIKYYKSFNFVINSGILRRALVMLPLVIAVIYTVVFLLPNRIQGLTSLYWFLFLFLSITPF